MGARGTKPGGATPSVVTIQTKRWPNPQPGMSEPARTAWKRIVKAYPYDHFKPQHYDQLRAFCEASAMHKKAVKALRKEGEVITQANGVMKENPWVGIMDKMAGRMQGLAVKLGITKNATINSKGGATGEAPKPKSKRAGLIFNG